MVGSSDSDSDDDKRVVRSAKDRRFDELKGTCEEMRVCLWHNTLCSASHTPLKGFAFIGCVICLLNDMLPADLLQQHASLEFIIPS